MASIDEVAADYIGRAKAAANPTPILREAAARFSRAAMDPKNAQLSRRLTNVAMGFARAARAPRPTERRATVSDFVDLLEETKAAIEEVGDHNVLDITARRNEIHEERASDAPRVSISPETFNATATLGRSAKLKYQPTNAERAEGVEEQSTAAFWQGVKREAQAMTIDAALTNPPTPIILSDSSGGVPNVRPFGIVEYGSDGNKTSVKFDLGMRFTVVGNYIAVLLGMDPPRADSPSNPIIVAGASIGAFAAPSQAPVMCSVYIDDLGVGATTDFIAIPTKGVRLMPIQSNLPLAGLATIDFFSYGGGIPIFSVFYQQANNNPMQPVAGFGDVSFIKVTNHGGAPANFRLPFQLSL